MEFGAQAITIGSIQIRYYGIIIVSAILVAAYIADRLAKRDGRDPDHVWGAMFWAVILGIIFARLWYILFPPISLTAGCDTPSTTDICQNAAWYFENFFNLQNGAIAIWAGGLHIFGAFIGGALGAIFYLRRNKLPVLSWFDIAAVALPLGQAIGRWANFINMELYGGPTGVSWWGIQIPQDFRVPPFTSTIEYPPDTLFHPIFLYESLWSLAAFFVLRYIFVKYRHQYKPGTIFLMYIVQYAFIRFLLEFLRVEVSLLNGINVSQVVAGIAFVAAGGLLMMRLQGVDGTQKRDVPVKQVEGV